MRCFEKSSLQARDRSRIKIKFKIRIKINEGQEVSRILRFRGAGFEPAGCQCIPDGIPRLMLKIESPKVRQGGVEMFDILNM